MKTVLVIDDNFEVRENTAELLELEGFKVILAANGREGFEQTKKFLPDVVLCDLMMPELDGMGYMNLLKSDIATANIPIILFSAAPVPADVNTHKYIYNFLRKPFTDVMLMSVISKCL